MLEANAPPFGTDLGQRERVELEMIAHASEFVDWKKFTALPLPCAPLESHVTDASRSDKSVSEKRKWMYHYQETIFASGAHYVFLGADGDVFPVGGIGPVGSVCAHGGSAAYSRLRGSIQSRRPLVMLYNTGGATQAFASIHRALAAGQRSSRDIVQYLEVTSKENWAKSFSVPEIMMMCELDQRVPLLFCKTIVGVDIVVDSAEAALSTLTGCFASIDGGIPELGLGTAETSAVLNAWARYLTLWRSARGFQWQVDALYWALLVLNLATALASVLYASHRRCGTDPLQRQHLRTAIVVLPVLAAFLATTRTRLRYYEKTAICFNGAALVMAEIYAFRARASASTTSPPRAPVRTRRRALCQRATRSSA